MLCWILILVINVQYTVSAFNIVTLTDIAVHFANLKGIGNKFYFCFTWQNSSILCKDFYYSFLVSCLVFKIALEDAQKRLNTDQHRDLPYWIWSWRRLGTRWWPWCTRAMRSCFAWVSIRKYIEMSMIKTIEIHFNRTSPSLICFLSQSVISTHSSIRYKPFKKSNYSVGAISLVVRLCWLRCDVPRVRSLRGQAVVKVFYVPLKYIFMIFFQMYMISILYQTF